MLVDDKYLRDLLQNYIMKEVFMGIMYKLIIVEVGDRERFNIYFSLPLYMFEISHNKALNVFSNVKYRSWNK